MDTYFYQWYRNKYDQAIHLEDIPEVLPSMELEYCLKRFNIYRPLSGPLNLWKIIFLCFWTDFLISFSIRIIETVLKFSMPLILEQIIKSMFTKTNPVPWHSFFWALTIWGIIVIHSLLIQFSTKTMYKLGLKVKAVLEALIYEKSLKISNEEKKTYSSGRICNLISIDAKRFFIMSPYMTILLGFPLIMTFAGIELYSYLGVSAIIGLSAFLFSVPFNYLGFLIDKKLQVKLYQAKDKRMQLLTQSVQGIKVLKSYAWELYFIRELAKIRNIEIVCLKKKGIFWACLNCVFANKGLLVILLCLTTYVFIDMDNNNLTAGKVFACLTIVNMIRTPLFILPLFMKDLIMTVVSFKRIQAFLNCKEFSKSEESIKNKDNVVEFYNANLGWAKNEMFFKNFTLNIQKGSLTAIIGSVGSGKSTLLSAILGELVNENGDSSNIAITRSKLAYVAQQTWIQNLTVRDNITFGYPLLIPKYNQAIRASEMNFDLKSLEKKDFTEIGENGTNLSGGQKQRLSICRAVYYDPEMILLDDPLSAVDAHVAKHLFKNVIGPNGILKNCTRVIATHNLSFLNEVDRVIVLENGKIVADGSFKDIQSTKVFKKIVKLEKPVENIDLEDFKVAEEATETIAEFSRKFSHMYPSENHYPLLIKEKLKSSRVSLKVYYQFFKRMGVLSLVLIGMGYLICEAIHTVNGLILSFWTDGTAEYESTHHSFPPTSFHVKYITIYSIILTLAIIMDFAREASLAYKCAKASDELHSSIMLALMKTSLSFFDITPIGQIINRLSTDIDTVDTKIPLEVSDTIWCIVQIFFVFGTVGYYSPFVLLCYLPIALFFYFVSKYYTTTKQKLQRLEFAQNSPLHSQFRESVIGCQTIRAFKAQDRFIDLNKILVKNSLKAHYMNYMSVCWLGVRANFLGSLIILVTTLFSIIFKKNLTPGLAGLILSMSLMVMDVYEWTLRCICELESDSVSLERLKEYEDIHEEAAWDCPADIEWKTNLTKNYQAAAIEFKNFTASYSPNTPAVLNNLNVLIPHGQKVGICGRTGAGKSSFASAILRILEPQQGELMIGNVNINCLGLKILRSNITIVPQDPVLFSGTLRFNLDPAWDCSDEDIWTALAQSHLSNEVAQFKQGLYQNIEESGTNLSVGQKQLICLARALLRKTKILIMDEATASMDFKTDSHIQETIKTEFRNCTVLTIAHRLNTIMDYDRILILSDGTVIEDGSPNELIKDHTSHFSKMAIAQGITK